MALLRLKCQLNAQMATWSKVLAWDSVEDLYGIVNLMGIIAEMLCEAVSIHEVP